MSRAMTYETADSDLQALYLSAEQRWMQGWVAGPTLEGSPLRRGDKAPDIEVVDAETMQPVDSVERAAVLAAAVFFGNTRLIDNIDLDPDESMDADEEGGF